MEAILGQPIRFTHCTRYTTLTDELSKLATDTNTKCLVVSCLTNIIVNLTGASDINAAIEKGMTTLGAIIRDLVHTHVGLRIFIGPCTHPLTL